MTNSRPANLAELSDLCTPWCVHVVATLRIANHIADGKNKIDDLGQAANCNAEILHRVLEHLVGKGVFEEPNPGHFVLNETARQLLEPGWLLGLDLDSLGGRFAAAWGTLLKYVRTGTPAYEDVFGLSFWEDLDVHPEFGAAFDDLMGPVGHGTPDADFEISGGWESVRSVVDVGGGTGAMLAEILRLHPHLKGTLVDLPKTVKRADEIFTAAGVSERVTNVGQSFFDPLPAGAGIYFLRKVLNDWPDKEAKAILKRCAEAAGTSGRVVVFKGSRPDDQPRGLVIEMLLVGGKLRTVAEFRQLARDSGLEVVMERRYPSGNFVIECRPTKSAANIQHEN